MSEEPASSEPSFPSGEEELAARLARHVEGGEELKLLAYGDLLDRARSVEEVDRGSFDAALEKLRERDQSPAAKVPWWRRHGLVLSWLGLMCLGLGLAFIEGWGMVLTAAQVGAAPPQLADKVKAWAISRQTPQSVLNFQPHTDAEEIEVFRSLWQKQPENPALYFVYCHIGLIHKEPPPLDFDPTWRRIDPQNAIWPMFEAEMLVPLATVSSKGSYAVSDPVKFARIVDLLKEASRMQGIDAFEQAHPTLIHQSFQPPRTIAEADYIQSYDASFRDFSGLLSQAFIAGAEALQLELGVMEPGTPEFEDKSGELRDFIALARRCTLLRATSSKHHLSEASLLDQLRGISLLYGYDEERTRLQELTDAMGRKATNPVPTDLLGKWLNFWTGPEYLQIRVLPELRVAGLIFGAGFLAIAGAVMLGRMSGSKRPAGQIAQSLWILRERRAGRTVFLLSLLPAAGWALSIPLTYVLPGIPAAPIAVSILTLSAMVHVARREVKASLGFLGIRSSRWSFLAGRISLGMAMAGLVATIVMAVVGRNSGQVAIASALAMWMLVAVLLGLFFGFFFRLTIPAKAISHRFMAKRVVPGLLLCCLWLCLLVLAMQPFETFAIKRLGDEIWTPRERVLLDAEARQGLLDLKSRWDAEER